MAKDKRIFAIKGVVCLLCVLLLCTMALTACYRKKITLFPEQGYMQISHKVCDLYYPSQWVEYVEIQSKADGVFFSANIGEMKVQLFDIYFAGDNGTYYDTIQSKNGKEVAVRVKMYPIVPDDSWTEENKNLLFGMQEDLNYLCQKLPVVENQVQLPTVGNMGSLVFYTPYGELRYPAIWEDYLQVKTLESTSSYVLEFYANVDGISEIHLFDVKIRKGNDGDFVLVVEPDGTAYSMSIDYFNLKFNDSWTQEQLDIIYGMIEDAGKLSDGLSRMDMEDVVVDTNAGVAQTPYGVLIYPAQFKDSIRVELESEDPYTMAFYGTVKGQQELCLYKVIFGQTLDNPVGIVRDAEGKLTQIGFIIPEFAPTESWTQEQIDMVYALKETMNGVAGRMDMEKSATDEAVDMIIATPYGDLCYPGNWKNAMKIEKEEGKVYKIIFSTSTSNGKDVKLFSILFGGEEGTLIGTIGDKNVYLQCEDLSALSDVSEEEMDHIYAMMEDTNYIMEQLN